MGDCVVLSFAIEPLKDYSVEVLTLTPVLNGTRLTELVMQFERERGFDPAGGYGGLVHPGFLRTDRWIGISWPSQLAAIGQVWEGIYVLGCNCGEVGCWPLVCQITKVGNAVVWDAFRQPHRPDRDYSHFGPFSFDLEQYKTVVNEIAPQFENPEPA